MKKKLPTKTGKTGKRNAPQSLVGYGVAFRTDSRPLTLAAAVAMERHGEIRLIKPRQP